MSTIKTNTLQNVAGTLSVPVDTVVQGSAKAWVNFNGTGTVAIRAAFNVSSITDNGTGDYTVNFTNALVDANYSVTGSSSGISGSAANVGVGVIDNAIFASNVRITTRELSSAATLSDRALNSVAIFR